MFLGEYHHNLDSKGRIAFPAKFRNEITDDTVVISRYKGECLACYSLEGWQKEYDKLMELNQNKAEVRKYIRSVTSKTSNCVIDDHGRILVPANLVELSGLDKACVFVGAGEHVELWPEDKWTEYEASISDDELSEIIENL